MAVWSIAQMERYADTGGVWNVHWRVTAEDGDYTASSYGTASFEPDASADGYVAYDSLTEETVIGWVKESLNAAEIESSLTANIESQKAPATLSGTPWA
jgi:uncharacterized lipoprotein NlpE involved in copper resistance